MLPSSNSFFLQYSTFLSFTLDLDILEKTGDEMATLGEQLEDGMHEHLGMASFPFWNRPFVHCTLS